MNTRPKQFLPGAYGADVPVPYINPPVQASAGNGPLAGLTPNYSLNLVNFDWITWHDYEWDNWMTVDALLQVAIGFLNIVGVWRPQTDYLAGQTVFDPSDYSILWLALVDHTSGTQFDAAEQAAYWQQRVDATPPVNSVFGRIGDVVAEAGDYAAFYASITHSHTESQITDLDKYTKAEVDALDAAVVADQTVINNTLQSDINTRLTQAQGDARYIRWSGAWSAGTYNPFQGVQHNGSSWLCVTQTTDEPLPSSTDWIQLGGGGSITVGDVFPTAGLAEGALHFLTVQPVGLYVYYDDGDSQQWVQTNGGSGAVSGPPYIFPQALGVKQTDAVEWPLLSIEKIHDGDAARIIGLHNGLQRWSMDLGAAGLEAGANAGSDFSMNRYADDGSLIDTTFIIRRDTGRAEFPNGFDLPNSEFHDPTEVASWRIIGTTFEQWGILQTNASGVVTGGYAKTLVGAAPNVQLTAFNGAGVNVELGVPTDLTQFQVIARVSTTGAGIQSWVKYHVIGRWDGIS